MSMRSTVSRQPCQRSSNGWIVQSESGKGTQCSLLCLSSLSNQYAKWIEQNTCLEILFLNHRNQRSDGPGTVSGRDVYHRGSLPTAPTFDFSLALRTWEPLNDGVSVNLCANCSANELRNGN